MKEKIMIHKKKIVIGLIIIVVLSIILLIVIKKSSNNDAMSDYSTEWVDEEPLTEEEKSEKNLMEIANKLYDKATEIYTMNPYCGISYNDIDEDSIVKINGIKYYRSNYTNINDIHKKISEVLNTNNITITDTIKKKNFIYCKYQKPIKSNIYLGNTILSMNKREGNIAYFTASSFYLSPTHSETCTIEDQTDCQNNDKVIQDTPFSIINVNGVWKVLEFHLHN